MDTVSSPIYPSAMPSMMQRIRVAALFGYEKAMPPLSVSVAGERLDVSTPAWRARFLSYWQPNWKTRLIGHFLDRRKGLFVDVGANLGQTLLDYLSCSSRQGYLGFEPGLEGASNVRRIIAANGLDDCHIVPVGLSNEAGLTRLFGRSANDQCATMLETLRPSRKQQSARTIATLRFDDLDVAQIAFIKIDVEGAELSVLEGMRNTLSNGAVPVLCEILRRDPAAEAKPYEARVVQLRRLITELGLMPYLVRKSPDLSGVAALEPVEAFPLDAFANDTRELNDYLLCPPGTQPTSI